MELSPLNIDQVIRECLFNEGEDTTVKKIGEGVMTKMGFHPERLKANEDNILSMLKELPDQFMLSKGGGYSFLNACEDRNGVQWTGMHQTVDRLIILGNAIGKVNFLMSRDMWDVLPGGMPYFYVADL